MEKPIYFSIHAREQMLLRGAEEDEAIAAIRFTNWEPAKNGKFHARLQMDYNKESPVNQQFYTYKAVNPIFDEQPGRIVVITVKVFYFN
jgi:hypothetical protein